MVGQILDVGLITEVKLDGVSALGESGSVEGDALLNLDVVKIVLSGAIHVDHEEELVGQLVVEVLGIGLCAIATEVLGEDSVTDPALVGDDVVQDIGIRVEGHEGDALPFAGEAAGHLNAIVETALGADALVEVLNTLGQPRGECGVLNALVCVIGVSAISLDPETDTVRSVLLDGQLGNLEATVPGVAGSSAVLGKEAELARLRFIGAFFVPGVFVLHVDEVAEFALAGSQSILRTLTFFITRLKT